MGAHSSSCSRGEENSLLVAWGCCPLWWVLDTPDCDLRHPGLRPETSSMQLKTPWNMAQDTPECDPETSWNVTCNIPATAEPVCDKHSESARAHTYVASAGPAWTTN